MAKQRIRKIEMSIYIRRQLQLKASQNSNMQNYILDRGNSVQDRIEAQAALAESIAGPIVVANATTDIQLSMGNGITTGRLFYLESDKNVTIKFNGTDAARALVLKVPATGLMAVMYLDVEYTSVYLSNASGASANVYYAVVGA